ncbi:MAG: hypothetical protein ACTHL8_26475 [Burkholderiaceae bacterium]
MRSLRHLLESDHAVVAVRADEAAARVAVDALLGAGFHARDLRIVGARCPLRPVDARAAAAGPALSASGMAWGLAWTALLSLAAFALPASSVTCAALALLVATLLLLHVGVVAHGVAPRPCGSVAAEAPDQRHGAHGDDLAAGRYLVAVSGARSELALAREMLAR